MATQTEIAGYIGRTDRTVRELMKKGILPDKRGRNGYDLKACVLAYIQHLEQVAKGGASIGDDGEGGLSSNADQHDERWSRLRADKLEIEVLTKLAQVAPIEMILELTSAKGAQVAGILDTIPAAISRAMPELPKSRLAIITEKITEARNYATEPIDLEPYIASCFAYGDQQSMEGDALQEA